MNVWGEGWNAALELIVFLSEHILRVVVSKRSRQRINRSLLTAAPDRPIDPLIPCARNSHMISRICVSALFIVISLVCAPTARGYQQESSDNFQPPRVIELWPKGAPGATGTSDEDKPAIIPYLPAPDKNTGAGVLICPGGAFTNRAVNHEGLLIAQWLKARGIAGFVLRYRILPLYTRNDSTQDALRGLRYLRARAAEFRLDPNRIGLIGFSAGAELATFAVFKPARSAARS